jgi:excinuclease ABC subunit C
VNDNSESSVEPLDTRSLLANLTHKPGIYRMSDQRGRVIYVGKAKDLKRRVSSYFQGRTLDAKTLALVNKIAAVDVTVTRTEAEALMLEYNVIKEHKPRFNIVLRDDKSYPYIAVSTNHGFPRLSFYRGTRHKGQKLYGPYPSAGSVRETLNQLQKLFRVRQCQDSYFANRTRPCLQYQLKRCTAPCVGLVSEADYSRDVEHALMFLSGTASAVTDSLAERMEQAAERLDFEQAGQYRDQLARLKRIDSQQIVSASAGDVDAIGYAREGGVHCITVLFVRGGRMLGSRNHFPRVGLDIETAETIRSFLLQYYQGREVPQEIVVESPVNDQAVLEAMYSEQGGRKVAIRSRVRGARARWLELAATNAGQGAALRARSNATLGQQLDALAEVLNLEERPGRLECFDVSHTGGDLTVASCVVFGGEGPLKNDYRRFNIQDIEPGDDYAAMHQALHRRYTRLAKGEGVLPDVLLIDGGKGQLSRALEVLDELQVEGVSVVAVAKGEARKPGREQLFVGSGADRVKLPANSPALHLIQQIRDEAHRFAITGHRQRRKKRQGTSLLEAIPGLGPKRRRELLRQFGGLKALSRAGVDDLCRVKGISKRLAMSIYERFHSDA